MDSSTLFEDVFEVKEANPDGKFFDKVSRYRCKSELYAADLLLDVNSDIYPLEVAARYTMRLSLTLTTDVAMQKDEYDPELHKRRPKPSMMDEFEYVMHGKVYKLDKRGGDGGGVRAEVNVSFGGLLFQLVADAAKLNAFELDSMVYLLVRKAA